MATGIHQPLAAGALAGRFCHGVSRRRGGRGPGRAVGDKDDTRWGRRSGPGLVIDRVGVSRGQTVKYGGSNLTYRGRGWQPGCGGIGGGGVARARGRRPRGDCSRCAGAARVDADRHPRRYGVGADDEVALVVLFPPWGKRRRGWRVNSRSEGPRHALFVGTRMRCVSMAERASTGEVSVRRQYQANPSDAICTPSVPVVYTLSAVRGQHQHSLTPCRRP